MSNVTLCSDGQKAIEICRHMLDLAIASMTDANLKPIDLVLTDFRMPFKTGIQVIREVRQYYSDVQAEYPLVVITEPRFVISTGYKSLELQNLMD